MARFLRLSAKVLTYCVFIELNESKGIRIERSTIMRRHPPNIFENKGIFIWFLLFQLIPYAPDVFYKYRGLAELFSEMFDMHINCPVYHHLVISPEMLKYLVP